jgi:hypothetical protein
MSEGEGESFSGQGIESRVDGGDILTRSVDEGMLVETPFNIIMKKRYGNARIQDWDQSRQVYATVDGEAAYVLLEGELLDVSEEINLDALNEWLNGELNREESQQPTV